MLLEEAAEVYLQCLTARAAHSARMGLPPAIWTESTLPWGLTTMSRRTTPPM